MRLAQLGRSAASRRLPGLSPRLLCTAKPPAEPSGSIPAASLDAAGLPSTAPGETIVPGWLPGFLRPEASIAPDGFNRWMALPPVVAVQLSVGSLYAWSIFNGPLQRELGVIASSSADWALADIVPIFSTTCVVFGLSVATLGKGIETIGPRAAAAFGTAFWGGGLALTGIGAQMHSLPLLYAGYGICGGLGFALGYTSPLANNLSWFPDKKGMATGIAVGGFGSGALVCVPLASWLMAQYRELPTLLGMKDEVALTQEAGRTLAQVGGELQEVVVATAESLKVMPGVVEGGVYVVGTGSTGLSATFLTLSGGYTALMLLGALGQRLPRAFVEASFAKKSEGAGGDAATPPYVPVDTFCTLPQFWLLSAGIFGNAITGITLISCAKTLMSECYSPAYPLLVDGAFAGSFVAGMSLANLGGRLFWPSVSDAIGRRNTFLTFGALGVPILATMPSIAAAAAAAGGTDTMPLYAFIGSTMALTTCYGGLLGVFPPYLADIAGQKNVASIYGRVLASWACAALIGPKLMTYFRSTAMDEQLAKLAAQVDPTKFEAAFGAPVDELVTLTAAKAVTIPKLLELLPPGTPDPSYLLYDTTMYSLSGVVGMAFVANALVRPVDPKYFTGGGGGAK